MSIVPLANDGIACAARPALRKAALRLLPLLAGVALLVAGMLVGSAGWPWSIDETPGGSRIGAASSGSGGGDAAMAWRILWEIRAPRSLGAWLAGALLGLSGALAQGLFRNPLADPYLLGSSSGAGLGVALSLAAGGSAAASGWASALGLTGAAFVGALAAVLLSVLLSRGGLHTARLLLAGIVVSVVLGAFTSLVMLMAPDVLRAMQAFLLGTTAFLGWSACGVLLGVLAVALPITWLMARGLDALALGEATAGSLGVPVARVRALLVAVLALATGAAVAQAGLVGFVGLAAPHLVRRAWSSAGLPPPASREHAWLSAAAGAALLLAADVVARASIAPQELPVGIVTAVLGGTYLLWLMRHPKR